MPILNITVDDRSPLINYQPEDAWALQNSTSDSEITHYHSETYTNSYTHDAAVSFSFNGTGVTVYGAKRPYYGQYSITLDDVTYAVQTSFSDPAQFQVPLFSEVSLPQGVHTLRLTNADPSGEKAVDIDFITWTTEIAPGLAGEQINNITVDDVDQAFTWTPPSAWSTDPARVGLFANKTGHTTSTPNASVSYTFAVSDAISLYGVVGPLCGPYQAQLDNQPPESFNAMKTEFTPQVLLYYADNIGWGNHTLTLTNQAESGNMQIDNAIVHTLASTFSGSTLTNMTGTADPSPSASDNPHKHLNAGLVGGVIASVVVLVALLAALFLVTKRNKTLWMRLQSGYMVQSQFDAPARTDDHSTDTLPLRYFRSSRKRTESRTHLRSTTEENLPLRRTPSTQSHLSVTGSLDTQDGSRMTEIASLPSPSSRRKLAVRRTGVTRQPSRGHQSNESSTTDLVHAPTTELVEESSEEEDEEQGEVVTEEDYGHIPVEGETLPPAYWQATAPYHSLSRSM